MTSSAVATPYGRREYRHVAKRAQPASIIGLGEAVLKWYDSRVPRTPVPAECVRSRGAASTTRAARRARAGRRARLRDPPPLRDDGVPFPRSSGRGATTTSSGRPSGRSTTSRPGLPPVGVEDGHRPTFCVWELGVVATSVWRGRVPRLGSRRRRAARLSREHVRGPRMSRSRLTRAPPEPSGVAAARAVAFRGVPRRRRGSSRGDPPPRIPAWRASPRGWPRKRSPSGVCPAGGGDQAVGDPLPRIPAWRASPRGCGRESGRLQGCAPPEAGIKPWGSAPADSHLAS